jgi:hypothetical protein
VQISLTQFYKLSFSEGKRKMPVNSTEINTGFPIAPGGTLNQVGTFWSEFEVEIKMYNQQIYLVQTVMLVPRVPSATAGSKQVGLAVRRCMRSKTFQLAPSTLFAESGHSDIFGFIISYRVRVKLVVSQTPLNSNVMAEVPVFIVAKRDSEHFSHHVPDIEKCTDDTSGTVTFRNRR